MKVVMLYRPQSDHRQLVEDYAREYERRGHGGIELIDVDSVQGLSLADTYQILDRPAVLVLDDESRLLAFWQGMQLPLYDEILGYLHS